ncbi:MAG TPA: hypothetical protein VN281_20815, partial [Verrucomicrobiae bacterium]|nr:hypothetical protein [Verrucomicrobiae bacterium]
SAPVSGAAMSKLARFLEFAHVILSPIGSLSSLFDLGNTPLTLPRSYSLPETEERAGVRRPISDAISA